MKRVVIFEISAECIAGMLTNGVHDYEITDSYPEDAEILAVTFDPWNETFAVKMEHESFEEVPERAVIPRIHPLVTRRS